MRIQCHLDNKITQEQLCTTTLLVLWSLLAISMIHHHCLAMVDTTKLTEIKNVFHNREMVHFIDLLYTCYFYL